MMEIDFERMERVRQSASNGFGRTFTAAWDAISKIEGVPHTVNLVWNIPNISWAEHIIQLAIEPVCRYKGYEIEYSGVKGRKVISIKSADEVLGTISFSHYKDTGYDFRGRDYEAVDDYGELALWIGRRNVNP